MGGLTEKIARKLKELNLFFYFDLCYFDEISSAQNQLESDLLKLEDVMQCSKIELLHAYGHIVKFYVKLSLMILNFLYRLVVLSLQLSDAGSQPKQPTSCINFVNQKPLKIKSLVIAICYT